MLYYRLSYRVPSCFCKELCKLAIQRWSMKNISAEEYQKKIEANKFIFDNGFEFEFIESLNKNVASTIDEVFFRSEFVGFDDPIERNNPDHPVIIISNHSGMAFPWDAMMFGAGYLKKMNYDQSKTFRALVAPMLSQTALMNPYMINDFWKRLGGVDATFLNFETMMHYKESNLLVYPEGVPGIGKGWNRKYELQRFATSFVRMSLKYKTDVVPYVTVNGENINPHTYSFEFINKLVRKIGIPFLPVGLVILLLPFQPWLFYYAWPAKLVFVRGKRLSPWKWIDKPYKDITEEEILAIRDRVQAQMQEELNAAVVKYGRKPYQVGEHLKHVWKNRKMFPFYLPHGWLFAFHEFIRLWNKSKPGEEVEIKYGVGAMFRMLIENPFTISYFIPILGWIPIMWRGYKGGIKKAPERFRDLDVETKSS